MTHDPSNLRREATRRRKLAQIMPYSDDTDLLRRAADRAERDAEAMEQPTPPQGAQAYMWGAPTP